MPIQNFKSGDFEFGVATNAPQSGQGSAPLQKSILDRTPQEKLIEVNGRFLSMYGAKINELASLVKSYQDRVETLGHEISKSATSRSSHEVKEKREALAETFDKLMAHYRSTVRRLS